MTDRSDPTHHRIGVLTPTSRVDLSVPAALTAAELLPVVLDLGRVRGADPRGWRLGRVGRSPLDPEQSLAAAGVHDGDLLDLRPGTDATWAPVYEDITDVTAAVAAETVESTGAVGRSVAAGAAVVLAAGTVVSAWRNGPPLVGVVAAAVLAVAAVARSRRGVRWASPVLGLSAIGVAAAAAYSWSGGWLASAVTVTAGAALGLVVLRDGRAVFVATTAGGLAAVAVAAARPLIPTSTLAAAVAVTGLTLLPLAPGLAARWCGLHRHPEPAGLDDEIVARMAVVARRAVDTATGLIAALAGTVAAAAVVSAVAGGVAAALAAVTVVVLALRSRSVAVRAQIAAHLVPAALAALVGAIVLVHRTAPDGAVLTVSTATAALGAVIAATTERRRPRPPAVDRWLRRIEGALILSLVPLAFAVMDGFHLVRHR